VKRSALSSRAAAEALVRRARPAACAPTGSRPSASACRSSGIRKTNLAHAAAGDYWTSRSTRTGRMRPPESRPSFRPTSRGTAQGDVARASHRAAYELAGTPYSDSPTTNTTWRCANRPDRARQGDPGRMYEPVHHLGTHCDAPGAIQRPRCPAALPPARLADDSGRAARARTCCRWAPGNGEARRSGDQGDGPSAAGPVADRRRHRHTSGGTGAVGGVAGPRVARHVPGRGDGRAGRRSVCGARWRWSFRPMTRLRLRHARGLPLPQPVVTTLDAGGRTSSSRTASTVRHGAGPRAIAEAVAALDADRNAARAWRSRIRSGQGITWSGDDRTADERMTWQS